MLVQMSETKTHFISSYIMILEFLLPPSCFLLLVFIYIFVIYIYSAEDLAKLIPSENLLMFSFRCS